MESANEEQLKEHGHHHGEHHHLKEVTVTVDGKSHRVPEKTYVVSEFKTLV